jgi:hypothetical protein
MAERHAGLKKLVILPIAFSFSPPWHGKFQKKRPAFLRDVFECRQAFKIAPHRSRVVGSWIMQGTPDRIHVARMLRFAFCSSTAILANTCVAGIGDGGLVQPSMHLHVTIRPVETGRGTTMESSR